MLNVPHVVTMKDKMVCMIASYANGQGADFAYIPHVYMSPMYRRKGIFSNMLEIVARLPWNTIRSRQAEQTSPAKLSIQRIRYNAFSKF